MKAVVVSLAMVMIALLAVSGMYSAVSAVGAPTSDNTTPYSPLSDNATPEIKPANSTLQDPTAQGQTNQPSINFDFSSQSTKDRYTVTGNENWELLIDINLPGWVYIYEYLPAASNPSGRWIAYKWQPVPCGIWKLGPFTPAENEPAGQHLYRVWYYADGKWAADNPTEPYKELAWTYVKGKPVQAVLPVTPPPVAPTIPNITTPVKEPADPFYKFITNPIVLLASPSLVVVIVILIRYLAGRVLIKKPEDDLIPITINKPSPKPVIEREVKDEQTQSIALEEPPPARAKLIMPGGLELQLNEKNRVIGRPDLTRALELDDLGLVSRKHFEITYTEDSFFIEDKESANGTSLNGKAIAGQGPVKLNDADLIELADVIKLKFQIL